MVCICTYNIVRIFTVCMCYIVFGVVMAYIIDVIDSVCICHLLVKRIVCVHGGVSVYMCVCV
jgi:hypothetical protein